MRMRAILATRLFGGMILALSLAGCATGNGGGGLNAFDFPAAVESGKFRFGVGPVPGDRRSLVLRVSIPLGASADGAPIEQAAGLTDEDWAKAAEAAAPKGCKVKSISKTAEGQRTVAYDCP